MFILFANKLSLSLLTGDVDSTEGDFSRPFYTKNLLLKLFFLEEPII
jgi:hypothetical protein